MSQDDSTTRTQIETALLEVIERSGKNYPLVLVFADSKDSFVIHNKEDISKKFSKFNGFALDKLLDWLSNQTDFFNTHQFIPGIQELEAFPMYFFWAKKDDPNVKLRQKISKDNFSKFHCLPNRGDYGWKKAQLLDFIFDVILPDNDNIEPKILQSYTTVKYYRKRLYPFFTKEKLCLIVKDYIENQSVVLLDRFLDVLEHEHNEVKSKLKSQFTRTVEIVIKNVSPYKYNWQSICKVLDSNFRRDALNKLALLENIDNPHLLPKRALCIELAKLMQKTILHKQTNLPMCTNLTTPIGQENVQEIPPEFFFTYTEQDPITKKDYIYCFDIRELYDQLMYQKPPYLNPYTKKEYRVNPTDPDQSNYRNSKKFFKKVEKEYQKIVSSLTKIE
jgi:hypothetical protein